MQLTLKLANLALLIAFPVSWFLPLTKAGLLPYFDLDSISIVTGIQVLWEEDKALALLTALFAMVAPIMKTAMLSMVQFNLLKRRAMPLIEVTGKLAMADVFLIALYIVIVKGVGVGRVETAWGLYVFTALVLLSMLIAYLSKPR
ncbi:paraquat-inducible protein A [Algicella marina]|uniref:Paraquat-inducible membrane protein A n=1 Tax=Algicella marina TaxID=2683284 RepID=A0A6P1SZN4_9RHOB|nr:paraquat-inducible protein A [Algicella marina]QHQ34833.1 paraquat-inducible membrane protein A [Algicella marina]